MHFFELRQRTQCLSMNIPSNIFKNDTDFVKIYTQIRSFFRKRFLKIASLVLEHSHMKGTVILHSIGYSQNFGFQCTQLCRNFR